MLLWIPLLPLLGFLVNSLIGRRLPRAVSGGLASLAMAGSFVASVLAVRAMLAQPAEVHAVSYSVFTWIASGDFQVPFTLRVDPLSAVMILVVTGIGFLIHLYSTAYMHEETPPEYARYFAYLNLFAAFMLVLVLASNFLVMFVGWEGVGLCSYLADRLLVSEAVGRRRGEKGVHRQSHRRRGVHPRRAAGVRPVRHAGFPEHRGRRELDGAGDALSARFPPSRSCCSSAPRESRRRFRSTSGCPTPWKAPRRCPR